MQMEPRFNNFLKARVMEFSALALAIFALGLAVAIADFEIFMDSLNAAGGGQNMVFGKIGGIAADLSLQVFGLLGSLVFLAALLIYAVKLLRKSPPTYWGLRLIALLTAIAALGGAVELAAPGGAYGGFLGDLFAQGLKAVFSEGLLLPLALPLAILVFFSLFYEAAALTLTQWLEFLGFVGRGLVMAISALRLPAIWRLVRQFGGFRLPSAPALRADGRVIHRPGPARVASPLKLKLKEGSAARRQRAPDLFNEKAGGKYEPPFHLLGETKATTEAVNRSALKANAQMLSQVLLDYGIEGKIDKVSPGPVVTLYELEPKAGVKSSRIMALGDDIARSMSAISARIAPVFGRNAIGIELPNDSRQPVFLRELLSSKEYERSQAELPLALGKNIGGEPIIVDLAKMPHLLIAGTTGSGKSVGLNAMILSILYRLGPAECRMIMVDPKMLELSVYEGIPHLMMPVVTEPKKAIVALKWAVEEMERRYRLIAESGCRNRASYNAKIKRINKDGARLPLMVIIVDEIADLMLTSGREIEAAIQRLSQMARAAGIHLIMATQRPSVDVITGTIKANFPCRLSFQVSSKIDSRTVLGESGAENLLGSGDMLYLAAGNRLTRIHGPFVSEEEVEAVSRWLKGNLGGPRYSRELLTATEKTDGIDEEIGQEDEFFEQAVELVRSKQRASTSLIQRHFRIGYNRAANLVEQMEAKGIVGEANHVGKREVFVKR